MFFIFTNSSVWEGVAAPAPEGELPATGLFVATNSFPRNSIVDITNIETNRTVRAVVANSLDSPGLLAIISREAVEMIGLREGSVGRIRMSQPSDPLAFIRMQEGGVSGGRVFDSGNVMTEDNFGSFSQPVANEERTPPSFRDAPSSGFKPYLLEPEFGGSGNQFIFDLPKPREEVVEQIEAETNEALAATQMEEEGVEEIAEAVEEEPVEEVAEVAEEEPIEEVAEVAEEEPVEEVAEVAEEEPVEEVAEAVEEEPVEEVAEVAEEEPVEEVAEVAEDEEIPPSDTVARFELVPAEERPPERTIYGIDPADIIPGITITTSDPVKEKEAQITETIPPIDRPPAAVVTPPAQAARPGEPDFSIPRIYSLDRGKFYVQVAALDDPQLVNETAALIDHHYEPKVYKDGDNWYRILLGPLNQGESAAVLQRFRSFGYKDAFVRRGG
uniref:SSU ribosomal protein S16p n=1 Tax=uncultured bacterium contig00032 TaxID=1181521 RepID=A0A806KFW5_9BACT|nr:SSU ribosomal protein S16p [uncultured bacterium contig00032]